jgi:anti-anti-sigma factor
MEVLIRNPEAGSFAEVHLRGDCDLYSAPGFKASILKRMDEGLRRILIDMSLIDYLDSSGVGAIVCILQAAKRVGGDIRFRGLVGSPRRVLERTNILPIMKEVRVRSESPLALAKLGTPVDILEAPRIA